MAQKMTRACRFMSGAAFVWLFLVCGGIAHASDVVASSQKANNDELWRRSVEMVSRGDFSAAKNTVAEIPAGLPLVDRVRGWLDEYEANQKERQQLNQLDHNKYVRYAKERIEREEYDHALGWTLAAAGLAVDRDAFLKEAWLNDLVDKSLAAAEKNRKDAKWRDAYGSYWQLAELFEREPRYKKLEREVLTHLRLESMFEKDSKWEERIEKVRWDDAEYALECIGFYYVEPADFKAITESGLEHMLLLAESRSARERFEGLKNEDDRNDFVSRIQRKLDEVRATPSLDWKDAVRHFRRVVRDINRQTIRLKEELVVSELMRGALNPLDEFTTIIWPEDSDEFIKHTRGDFIGVGISIVSNRTTDEIEVVTPLDDTPAYHAGIQAGDIITHVDGKPIKGLSINKCVDIITGPENTDVTLTIRRNEENRDYELTRKRVKIQSVKGVKRDDGDHWDHWLDDEQRIAYVRFSNFQRNSVEDLENTLDTLTDQGMRGVVLDLRDNPGGLLDTAWRVSSMFLKRGDSVVSTRGRHANENQRFDAPRDGKFADLPVVVMTNENSASASEIFAGAIKDNHHGAVVGARTFGKFSVQNLIPLSRSRAKLKLTTARYFLPSGVSLHREPTSATWGVEPDIDVQLAQKERINIWKMRRESERIGPPKPESKKDDADDAESKDDAKKDDADDGKKDGDEDDEKEKLPPIEQPDKNERPMADPQRDTALLVMRLHLLADEYPTLAAAPVKEPNGKTANP